MVEEWPASRSPNIDFRKLNLRLRDSRYTRSGQVHDVRTSRKTRAILNTPNVCCSRGARYTKPLLQDTHITLPHNGSNPKPETPKPCTLNPKPHCLLEAFNFQISPVSCASLKRPLAALLISPPCQDLLLLLVLILLFLLLSLLRLLLLLLLLLLWL